ncbi:MAG: M23 family metallopeptidase, partial [bacterium]
MGTMLAGAWLVARAAALGQEHDADQVRFSTRQEGERFVVTGENLHPAMPYHVLVSFPVLSNLRASLPLPARLVIPPATRMTLLTLARVDPHGGSRMNASYLYGMGDPGVVPDAGARYLFPYAHGSKFLVSQGYFGAFTHRGKHALDFQLPEGTPVCAARDGVVVGTKADFTRGGPGPEFAARANFVDVLHADGTWADYAHLKPGGVAVRVAQRVAAGQVLGYAGSTGQTNGPHLHFAVFRASWEQEGGVTIPTAFAHLDGATVSPEEGKWYYAVHPGGAAFTPILAERLTDAELDRHDAPAAADGKISFRPETVDDRILIYCA